jgi:seryl-tRNA synthetase
VLDVRAIREDPDPFRKGLARRNLADAVDLILALDERRRQLTVRVEELRAEQNRSSKAIGRAEGEDKQRLIGEVARVSAEVKELEPQLEQVEAELSDLPRGPRRAARVGARRGHRRGGRGSASR